MITVGIATYNRASVLKETLESFKNVLPPKSEWELIVVDNNSSDNTEDICKSSLPPNGKYLFEPSPGVSIARNRVLKEAKGDLIVFTDDDSTPCKEWLLAYEEGAARYPKSSFFIGPVTWLWRSPQPWWFKEDPTHKINFCYKDDLGEKDLLIKDICVAGVNMAVRKDAYIKCGGFRETLGIIGPRKIGGEEQDLIQRFKAQGMYGYYIASAKLGHRIYPKIATLGSLITGTYAAGSSDSEILRAYRNGPILMGMPRWWWRFVIEIPIIHGGHTLGHLIAGQKTQFIHHILKLIYWAGMIRTFWQPRRLVYK